MSDRSLNDERGLTPAKIQRLWGVSPQAQGVALNGYGASLWNIRRSNTVERLRPACGLTHVVSIWTSGEAASELYLDNHLRFRQMRRRGTFQLARAGEDLRVILSQSKGSCLDIYVPESSLRRIVEDEFDRPGNFELRALRIETDSLISRVGDEIAFELLHPGYATQVAIDSAMLALSVSLVRRWSNLTDSVRLPRQGLTQLQVKKTIDLLSDTLHRDIKLDQLARELGLSTFHFARAFKASVGVPPHKYQVQLRLARARDLLEKTRLTVNEIANRVGYEDGSYFTRAFKKEFVMSPGAYRRNATASRSFSEGKESENINFEPNP